jgi:alpha-tubulin suppressor-like RCC1 family protein
MVGAGGAFSCALADNGTVYCWGSNQYGELGTPAAPERCQTGRTQETQCSTVPVAAGGQMRAKYLSVGQGHACAITTSGTTMCWGRAFGPNPVAIEEHHFAIISAGSGHTCGLEAGRIWCWGSNTGGKLGNGTTAQSSTPVAVTGTTTFGSVRTGFNHTCGISTSLSLFCWGANFDGQLGNGTQTDSATPVEIR